MPAFYPNNGAQYSNPVPESTLGYKQQTWYPEHVEYQNNYADYRGSEMLEPGRFLPDPYDRFNKSVPPSAMYSQPHFSTSQTDFQPAIGAPMIAPLRVDQRFLAQGMGYQQQRQQGYHVPQDAPVKEEKTVGGVSATLDYEVEQMADFVAETAAGMYDLHKSRICVADIDLLRSIRPGVRMPPTFRKWVLGVLNATRLPSATILLSLSYLAMRMRKQSGIGSFVSTERGLTQMLTVSLILGSKFLDDNTFQNKSWAEVSNITVAELNREERDWLASFDHRLHHDPHCADGFEACAKQWKVFKTRPVLRPVDTNIPRQTSMQTLSSNAFQPYSKPTPTYSSPANPSGRQYLTPPFTPYDTWFGHRSNLDGSPASAPGTAPHTPDYYGNQGAWSGMDRFAARHNPYAYPVLPAPYAQQPSYGHQFPAMQSQNFWNCHGASCQCGSCRQAQTMAPRYGPIVVG